MATMRLYKPANEHYENSYRYQSAYAKPEYGYGLGQNHTQHYSQAQFQNQSSAFAPASHASSAMNQSSYINTNSSGVCVSPALGGFPVNQHSASHAYSQHGSSYGMGHQSAFGSAQNGSYGMRKQGGFGGLAKQSTYSSAQHGSYGSAHNGLLGPVQQSYGSAHNGLLGPVQQSYGSSQHGSYSLGHHGSFGSAAHTPSTNYAMKRRQKSSYYRRSSTGFRSGETSDSDEEEEADEEEEESESENEHEHHLH